MLKAIRQLPGASMVITGTLAAALAAAGMSAQAAQVVPATIAFSGNVASSSDSDTADPNVFGVPTDGNGVVTGSASFDQTVFNARQARGRAAGLDGGLNNLGTGRSHASVVTVTNTMDPTMTFSLDINGSSVFNHADARTDLDDSLVLYFARTPVVETVPRPGPRPVPTDIVTDFEDDFFFVGFELFMDDEGRQVTGGGPRSYVFENVPPFIDNAPLGEVVGGETVPSSTNSADYVLFDDERSGSGGAIVEADNFDPELVFVNNIRQDLNLSPDPLPAVVPIPAALPLLASGLIVAGAVARRKRRRVAADDATG